MTTAHRPTWTPASGEASDYGNWSSGGKVSSQFSVKDLPGHTKLKLRKPEQIPELTSRADVERAEEKAEQAKVDASKRAILDGPAAEQLLSTGKPLMLMSSEVDTAKISRKYDDADDREEDDESDLDTSSDEDDDEDEEELLQRELEKIKQEREEARLKKEAEEAEAAEADASSALSSNPLLDPNATAQVKRKWNDDVVFKNQARSEPDVKKRFVNDTIRNDFHRKFLSKFMK